jgi:hypothetical protein
MFYEENQINKLLNCSKCFKRFDLTINVPKVLPCGKFFFKINLFQFLLNLKVFKGKKCCLKCIQAIKYSEPSDDDSTSQFKCIICSEEHNKPKSGTFPTCETLSVLLEEKPNEVYRSQNVETLKTNLNEIRLHLDKLEYDFNNGIDIIKEHAIELRTLLQLATEQSILDLHKFNEIMIKTVDNYEIECINKFTRNNRLIREKFDPIIKETNQFDEEVVTYLKRFQIDDKDVLNLIDQAVKFNSKLKYEKTKLANEIFDGKIKQFVRNKKKMTEQILGRFGYENMICLDDLNKRKLKNLIFSCEKSSKCSIVIDMLDNGFYFIAYQNTNSTLVFFTLNDEEKSQEKIFKNTSILNVKRNKNQIALNYILNGNNCVAIIDHQLNIVYNNFIVKKILKGASETFLFFIAEQDEKMNTTALINQPLHLYNWKNEFVSTLGQRTNINEAFYFTTNIKQLNSLNGKYVYLTDTSLVIMDVQKGICSKTIQIEADKFEYDSSSKELILLKNSERKLVYYDLSGELIKEIELSYLSSPTLFKFSMFIDFENNLKFFDEYEHILFETD